MSNGDKKNIRKISYTGSTQPLYEAADGKEFTIADIVQGKIKAPKKYRSKSLSYRFRSKNKKNSKKKASFDESLAVKNSYYNGKVVVEPVRNMPSINVPGQRETGAAGYIPNDITSIDGEENEEYFFENDADDACDNIDDPGFSLKEFLSNMHKKSSEAQGREFFNFLIKKADDSEGLDYSDAFNDLLIKINDSDVDMKNSFIKGISSRFSSIVNINISNGHDIDSAKMLAYKRCVSIVTKKLGEL